MCVCMNVALSVIIHVCVCVLAKVNYIRLVCVHVYSILSVIIHVCVFVFCFFSYTHTHIHSLTHTCTYPHFLQRGRKPDLTVACLGGLMYVWAYTLAYTRKQSYAGCRIVDV